MLDNITIKNISNILTNAGCNEIFLFGSQLNGTANEFSDIDIGVKGLNPRIFFSVHSELEKISKMNVDLVDFDEKPKFFDLLKQLNEIKKIR